MHLQESAEMYIETIHRLSLESGCVRSVDVAESMGYSKPSVCRAVGILKQNGYIFMDENRFLHLTDAGKQVAKKVYERHMVLSRMLTALGVDEKTAARDACRIEHIISDESFAAIKRHIEEKSTHEGAEERVAEESELGKC